MTKQKKKKIGLIGGMGPYASAFFYKLLLTKSRDIYGALHNNEFPEIVIDSLPVPDFISDTSHIDEAREMLLGSVRKLNAFGVDTIAMVCNTGHILYQDLSQASGVPVVSLIEEVGVAIQNQKLKKVGLLATATTVKTGLYKNHLKAFGITTIDPDKAMQKLHEEIIRELISGSINKEQESKLYRSVKSFVAANKLEGIILGCTELPLIFPKEKFSHVIDCMDVLANALLKDYYESKTAEERREYGKRK